MVSEAQLQIAIMSTASIEGFQSTQRAATATTSSMHDLMVSASQLHRGISAVAMGLHSFGIVNEETMLKVKLVGDAFWILQGTIRTVAAAYDIAKIAALAFQAASGPIGWICLAIAAAAMLIVAIWQNWGGINEWLASGIRKLGEAFLWLYDHTIKPLIEGVRWLIDGFKQLGAWIGGALKGLSFDFG